MHDVPPASDHPSAARPTALTESAPLLLRCRSPRAIGRASAHDFLKRVSGKFEELARQDATDSQTYWDGYFEHRWNSKSGDFLFAEAFLRVRYPTMSRLVPHVRAMDGRILQGQAMTSGYFAPPRTGWLKSPATVGVAGGPQHTAVHYAWALGHEMLVHAVQYARERPEWVRDWKPLSVRSFRQYWNVPYERLARQGAATATRALVALLVRLVRAPELLDSMASRPASAASRAMVLMEQSASEIQLVLRSAEQRAANHEGKQLPARPAIPDFSS